MEITVKRFDDLTTAELYEILRCRSEVFVCEQNCDYQDMDGLDKWSTHLFIGDERCVRAYLRVIDPGVKVECGAIGRVLTMKEFRGQGLARPLLMEAIRIAKSKSDKIEIEAQAYLRNFYRSLGFVETSDVFMLDGIEHISMVLE
ncbi:MAG: GNAT family N-acetyltransferase [Muribaculaceae bacterium]|nr:GNAT family N-acetyltransferase [Muribaculaceae bacterium]